MKKILAEKIDHVMICVKDLKQAVSTYADLFKTEFYPVEPLALGPVGVKAAALNASGLELIEAHEPGGRAAEFMGRAGEAPWGIAFKVPDVEQALEAAASQGVRLLGREDGPTRKAAVLEPEDAHGVMIKLVEYFPAYTVADLEYVTRWRKARGMSEPVIAGKLEKVDHVLVYIENIEAAREKFGNLFHTKFPEPHRGTIGSGSMCVDGLGIELISGGSPDSGAMRFIRARKSEGFSGEGVGAISLKVSEYESIFSAMKGRNIPLLATRDLPTRKVALFSAGGGIGAGFEIIEYRPLAHPIVCQEMYHDMMTQSRAGG